VEILTNILAEQQFRQELSDAMSFLAQRGISDAAVSFGFTLDAPELQDIGVSYTVPIADVPAFIEERERTKGFHLGFYDCWIEPSGLDADFSSATTAIFTLRLIPSRRSVPSVAIGKRRDLACIQMSSGETPNQRCK
jgi:hypothetical protein